jgi:2-polyprenyl-6-methoxyphenol hydroxylase-like FAD-dependent oxidoreductase
LRDAHLLGRLLPAVNRGERDLVAAVGDYEGEMREYGAAAVRYSLEQLDQALATGAAAKAGVRAFFRLCQLVPALRRRAFAKAWLAPAEPFVWEHNAA